MFFRLINDFNLLSFDMLIDNLYEFIPLCGCIDTNKKKSFVCTKLKSIIQMSIYNGKCLDSSMNFIVCLYVWQLPFDAIINT